MGSCRRKATELKSDVLTLKTKKVAHASQCSSKQPVMKMAETMSVIDRSPLHLKTDNFTRKNKKPLMEKRRRARINNCLSQLKSLVLHAIKKESSQFSKLEKADILELTVRHLRALHRQQVADTINQEPAVTGKYQAGFSECAKEVMRFIGSVTEVNTDVKSRVMDHLNLCLHVVNCSPAASSEDVADQRLTQRPVHTSQQDTDVRNLLPSSVTKAVPSVVCVTSVRSASTLNGGISDIGINDILPSISTTALRLSSMPSPFSNNFKASCPDFKLFPVQSKQQPSSVSMSTRTTLTPTLHILSNSENRTGTVALFLNGTDTNRSLSAISDMSSVDDSKTNINAIPMYTFSSAVLSTDGDKVNNSHNYPVSMDSCSCMPMHDFHQLVHNSPSSLHLGAQCQDFCTGNVSTSESFVSVPVDLSPPYKAKCNSRQFLSSPVTEIYQPWRPW